MDSEDSVDEIVREKFHQINGKRVRTRGVRPVVDVIVKRAPPASRRWKRKRRYRVRANTNITSKAESARARSNTPDSVRSNAREKSHCDVANLGFPTSATAQYGTGSSGGFGQSFSQAGSQMNYAGETHARARTYVDSVALGHL